MVGLFLSLTFAISMTIYSDYARGRLPEGMLYASGKPGAIGVLVVIGLLIFGLIKFGFLVVLGGLALTFVSVPLVLVIFKKSTQIVAILGLLASVILMLVGV